MKSRSLFTPTRAWLLLCAAAAANGQALQLYSTLDLLCWNVEIWDVEDCPLYGPDGPWQATLAFAGNQILDGQEVPASRVPVLPDGHGITELMSVEMGPSLYNLSNSHSADNKGLRPYRYNSIWDGGESNAATGDGPGCTDSVALIPRDFSDFEIVNASIAVANSWTYDIGSAPTRYNATVGRLGLGPVQPVINSSSDTRPGLLNQLKNARSITSESWSLHLGSAWLQQRASMVLGGYEQNRLLGDVAVFNIINGNPRIPLVDVFLGVEAGSSPFDGTAGSQWHLVDEEENRLVEEIRETNRAPRGSISIIPNPAVSFISLPPAICNAIAAQLPVTWRDSFGLFTWNVDDPQFERIVNSPAYLGFVFSDWEARNHTIKIPFKLLNLTLEAPIVDNPTRYFPCQPMTPRGTGFYQLGRAFLQGAFVGFNYEKNVTYLAQGPGPDMAQSVLRPLEVEDDVPRSNTIDGFAESWMALWTVLEDDAGEESSSEGGSLSEEGGADRQSRGRGLSTGAKAGAAVGAVCGLILVAVVAALFWRRRRRQQEGRDQAASSESGSRGPGEKTKTTTAEAHGTEMRHELEAPWGVHELTVHPSKVQQLG